MEEISVECSNIIYLDLCSLLGLNKITYMPNIAVSRFYERPADKWIFQNRFGCCICLGPKLNMVSGRCQHRICDDCLYVDTDRRPCMDKCPVCCMEDSFPQKRPILPEQVIEIQRCIGVQECPNGCSAQIWYWEVEEHTRNCPKSCRSPVKKAVTRQRRRSRVSDRGCVTTSRTPRRRGKRT